MLCSEDWQWVQELLLFFKKILLLPFGQKIGDTRAWRPCWAIFFESAIPRNNLETRRVRDGTGTAQESDAEEARKQVISPLSPEERVKAEPIQDPDAPFSFVVGCLFSRFGRKFQETAILQLLFLYCTTR